jgi:deazaflavin-dependent oxidoreductase (nitroreductase family)
MLQKIATVAPPTGVKRLLFRAPIYLYRWGLGWLLGRRFLLLHHVGRKTGLPRQATVEVVGYDEDTDTHYIAAGFGKHSDWYKNLLETPEVDIEVGRRRIAVTAVPLDPEQSGRAMVRYARRYPKAARRIARFCGYKVDGSEEDYFLLGRDVIPFVALRPRAR